MSNPKRIQYNAADRDYSAYYDDQLIGIFATYTQAEIELDAHALDLLERGLIDSAEGITTMQWQAPRDVVLARPAEVVEPVFVSSLPVDPTTVAIARTSCASDGPVILSNDRQATVDRFTCPLCQTDAHRATQCPDVALTKYGMGVWDAYMEDRAAFLKLVQWATAQRLALMGDAVASYLSVRWGHTITGYQVLAGWHRNAAPAQS